MLIDKSQFNFSGEFVDKQLEDSYKNEFWNNSKQWFFIAYNICCILLLLAGVLRDYDRSYLWGSPDLLTSLRIGLVLSGLLLYFLFYRKIRFPKYIEAYCFYLSLYSVGIIALMASMVGGQSNTLLAGVLIMTFSFYAALPNRFWFSVIPSFALFISYALIFDYSSIGLSTHFYMVFMILSINIVMMYFKIANGKNSRINFLITQYHREVSQAKNTIIGIIGHDLKNPLTIVKNYVEIIRRNHNKANYEKLEKQLGAIENSSERVEVLLQNLLSWALSESGKESSATEEAEIEPSFKQAIDFCQELADAKKLKIKSDVENHRFKFNPNMIETVIRNLLGNSIKFSPDGAEILVRGNVSGDKYHLRIKDNGVGMSPAVRDQVLDGANTHTTLGTNGEKGSGVGLRIVHHFIKTHQGKLEIESTPDKGSEFIVELPVVK